MKLISLISFLVLLIFEGASANEEYFKKSVLLALKEKNGQVTSQIQTMEKKGKITFDDKYSFSPDISENVLSINDEPLFKSIYLNSSEFYVILIKSRICISQSFNYSKIQNLNDIAPIEAFNKNLNYSVLGPNVLLEVLYENLKTNPKSVECVDEKGAKKKNPKKCTLTIKEKTKIEYHFEDKDQYTMYPNKIVVSNQKEKNWTLFRQFDYLNFEPSFDAKPILTSNLPIGFGCKRLNRLEYPQITPFFGNQFETDLNVTVTHIDLDSKMRHNKTIYLQRQITVKLNVNLNDSIIMADADDKQSNTSARVMVDLKDKMVYALINSQMCVKISANKEKGLNLAKIEEEIIKNANKSNYSYLGEYNVGDVPCLVFEAKEKINQTEKNPNGTTIKGPDTLIATDYYPKDKKYWSTNNLEIPILSEQTALNYEDHRRPLEFAKVTINFKTFESKPKSIKKFDTSKCTETKL